MESTGIRAEIPPSPWRLSISLLVISEGLWALLRSPVENQNCSVFFWCVFEIAQLEGRKIQEEPQVSIQNSLDWVWSESPGGFGTPGLLQWKLMRSYNLEIKGRCKMRKGKVVVNSPTWLRFWGKFSLLMLLLSDEIQFCNPQKTNSLLWDRMPVYLPHWKFDFPWKAPEWLTKSDALFLPRLIGWGAFSTQIEQITFFPRWGSEWMLDSFQTKSRSSSEPRRFKSVSTLNIWRAFVLPCLHSVGRFKFFQWNIWGLFDSKGKAAIWGLIPPKSPVLLWMSWRVSGKFIPFPLLTAERWYPPSGSAVFLDPFCYQLCSSFENRYFFFLRLCYRYSDFSESRRGRRYC